jgi:hypothetical protein
MSDRILSRWFSSVHATCADDTLEFFGITESGGSPRQIRFEPDMTRGYLLLKMSHSFPVVNMWIQGIMPAVIEKSFRSLLDQNVNYAHKLIIYDKDKIGSDRIIGSVKAVNFVNSVPSGNLPTKENAPAIEAVASFTKLASGMDRIVGRHTTGRQKFSVSMECTYLYDDCGFCVAIPPKAKSINSASPDYLVKAGWDYWNWTDAPEELVSTFNKKKKIIDKQFKGRSAVLMLGGLDNEIHYDGVAIVEQGAEREAEIIRMAASAPDTAASQLVIPLMGLGDLLRQISDKK